MDAQLPRRLAYTCRRLGWDVKHTLDLPLANRTSDGDITQMADQEERFVVTKDADFRHEHLLHGRPARLLYVATGNIPNQELILLFEGHASHLAQAAQSKRFLILTRDGILTSA